MKSTSITYLHCVCLPWFLALLTGIILWCHGSVQDLSEDMQPLSLLPVLLTHEDKLSHGRLHHNATLPLVSPSVLWNALLHRVTSALCADENDP